LCTPSCVLCCFLLNKLLKGSIQLVYFAQLLNTLGTGYLNCLYAYKRKSASPVLNVLTTTASLFQGGMYTRAAAWAWPEFRFTDGWIGELPIVM
jgi:hypothetical protein